MALRRHRGRGDGAFLRGINTDSEVQARKKRGEGGREGEGAKDYGRSGMRAVSALLPLVM